MMPKSSAIATGPTTGHTEKGRILEISYWICSTTVAQPGDEPLGLGHGPAQLLLVELEAPLRELDHPDGRGPPRPRCAPAGPEVSCTLAAEDRVPAVHLGQERHPRRAPRPPTWRSAEYRTGAPPNMYASRLRSSSLACSREARTGRIVISRSSLSMRSSAATMSDWLLEIRVAEAVHPPLELPDLRSAAPGPCPWSRAAPAWTRLSWSSADAEPEEATPTGTPGPTRRRKRPRCGGRAKRRFERSAGWTSRQIERTCAYAHDNGALGRRPRPSTQTPSGVGSTHTARHACLAQGEG